MIKFASAATWSIVIAGRLRTSGCQRLPFSHHFGAMNSQQVPKLPMEVEVNSITGTKVVTMAAAQPEEAEEIFEFMVEHYLPGPPMRQIYQWEESEENRRPKWRLEETRQRTSQPYSLVVREAKAGNKIVAICINVLEERHHQPDVLNTPADDPTVPGWLDGLLCAELHRGVDLFDRYKTDRVFTIGSAVVRPDYRRSGLFSRMMDVSLALAAREGNAGAAKAEAFSEYSAQAMILKAGFEVIRSLDFASLEFQGTKPLAHHFNGPDANPAMAEFRTARLLARRL